MSLIILSTNPQTKNIQPALQMRDVINLRPSSQMETSTIKRTLYTWVSFRKSANHYSEYGASHATR